MSVHVASVWRFWSEGFQVKAASRVPGTESRAIAQDGVLSYIAF